MNKLVLSFVVFLLSSAFAASGALVLDEAQSYMTPAEVASGDSAKFILTVRNELKTDITSVTLNFPGEGDIVVSPSERAVGAIKAGESITNIYKVIVGKSANDGKHTIDISAAYKVGGKAETADYYYSVYVKNRPKLDVSLDVKTISSNDKARLGVKLRNVGGENINKISLAVGKTRYLVPLTVTNTIEALSAGEEKVVYFDVFVVEDASGAVDVPLDINYEDSLGMLREESFSPAVSIAQKAGVILSVSDIIITPSHTETGETASVIIYVKNSGMKDANNVKIVVSDDVKEITSVSKKEYPLGYMGAYSTKSADMTLKVAKDAVPKMYPLPIQLQYTEDGKQLVKEHIIYLDVIGRAEVDVSGFETTPSVLYSGSDFVLNVVLENSGTDDARAIEVQLGNVKGITGAVQNYVALIKPGERSAVSFNLHMDNNALSGNYVIPLDLSYTRNDKSVAISRNMTIKVLKAKEDPLLFAAVSLAVMILVYLLSKFKVFD